MTEWSPEREFQVLALFRDQRRKLRFLCECRCPSDGGLLGAACKLPDGIWAWTAGSRMSPAASWAEFSSQYTDVLNEEDWTEKTQGLADGYANEQVREWDGRLELAPSVMKILPVSDDEPIRVQDHESPESRAGVALTRVVTCRCRTHYLLPVLALAFAGIRVSAGLARPSTKVRPMTMRVPGVAREAGESLYAVDAAERVVVDIRERH